MYPYIGMPDPGCPCYAANRTTGTCRINWAFVCSCVKDWTAYQSAITLPYDPARFPCYGDYHRTVRTTAAQPTPRVGGLPDVLTVPQEVYAQFTRLGFRPGTAHMKEAFRRFHGRAVWPSEEWD